MVFSVVKNIVGGLSGSTAKKASAKAVAASEAATAQNNALAANIYSDQKSTLAPYTAQGGLATSYINGLLGIGSPADSAAAKAGFEGYKNSTGYQSRLAEGERAVTNNAAVGGMLNSGSTLKGLTKFGQDFATQESDNYYNKLAAQQGVGLSGSSAQVGVANNYSSQVQSNNSTNASNIGNAALAQAQQSNALVNGLIGAAGTIGGALIKKSDRRAKIEVVAAGMRSDGLTIYEWTYRPELHSEYGDGRHQGVMADEVALLAPHALGPIVDGYATVNYSALGPN